MKILLIALILITSVTSFANDVLKGSVSLKGKQIGVIVETNSLNAKYIFLNKKAFRIARINKSNLTALSSLSSVNVFFGKEVIPALETMSNSEILQSFGISNGAEINCANTSKGFLVFNNGRDVIGNCIN